MSRHKPFASSTGVGFDPTATRPYLVSACLDASKYAEEGAKSIIALAPCYDGHDIGLLSHQVEGCFCFMHRTVALLAKLDDICFVHRDTETVIAICVSKANRNVNVTTAPSIWFTPSL